MKIKKYTKLLALAIPKFYPRQPASTWMQCHLVKKISYKRQIYMDLKIRYFTSYVALAIPKFYQQQPASAWMDTQWCVKPQRTGLKHQRIHNSCFLVKHLEFARVIQFLYNFHFKTPISLLLVRIFLTK